MPVVILDANILQIMGGHPDWVEPWEEPPSDPQFSRLPKWYQYEIWALGAINEVIPRCYSTAWVPAPSALAELGRGRGRGAAQRSLSGWGGEIADWARRWFWGELRSGQMSEVMGRWMQAQQLDLSFLRELWGSEPLPPHLRTAAWLLAGVDP